MADRRFSDQEVGEILKAAAEIQSGLSPDRAGMTLNELKRVAQEVGIDPDNIARAATQLSSGQGAKPSDSLLLERTISGEITEEAWEEVVNELRRFTGLLGKTEIKGMTREWTGGSDTGRVMLSATFRRGRTKLRLLGNTGGAAGVAGTAGMAVVILALIPVIVGVKVYPHPSPLLIAACSLAIAVFWIGMVTLKLRAYRRGFDASTEQLLERVAAIAEATSSLQVPQLSLTEELERDRVRVDGGTQ